MQCLSEELAMADGVLKHPTLRPPVAPMYQYVVGSAALSFARQRVELMLTWAVQKLGLTWREDTRQQVEDRSIRVHVGPAVFRLSEIFVLQLAEERSRLGRNGSSEFESIERVVLMALWNEIPKEFWPKGLKLPKLTTKDAAAAARSQDGALHTWVVTTGVQYFP